MRISYEIGKEAEAEAARWFVAGRRAQLLAQNYRCRGGEIDLIFEETRDSPECLELVFIEVKARTAGSWVEGLESVGWQKQRRLKKAARHFLSHYRGNATRVRFDLLHKKGETWEHVPNIHMGDDET